MKKNCYNCKHLGFEIESDSDGYNIGSGHTCEHRYAKENNKPQGKPDLLNDNLCRPEYLEKAKVCFEPKVNQQPAGQE